MVENPIDDAIVVEEDDAIVIEEEPKPLWKNDGRVKYSHDQLIDMYALNTQIDLNLFVDGYFEMFEVFNT